MKKNIHANIMLDLECTGILPNPCILQIGAVHFDLDTGEEYSHFCTPVSLKSCEDVHLESTEETLRWLLQNSPQVLTASKTSEVSISQALFRFNIFLRNAIRKTRQQLEETGRLYASDKSEPMIWGNGAVADNIWINSAYTACDMADRKPWTYKNDMCVRTLVRTANDMLGRDFAKEERFQGTRHDALDDCRHQIRYMVKARNALMALSKGPKQLPDATPAFMTTIPIRVKQDLGTAETKSATLDNVSADSADAIPLPLSNQVLEGNPSHRLETEASRNETLPQVPVTTALDKIDDTKPNSEENQSRSKPEAVVPNQSSRAGSFTKDEFPFAGHTESKASRLPRSSLRPQKHRTCCVC
ncbi:hypothetical protein VTL71DRAFT_6706 [Oculimacula yallundae]|uniref:3'-5' exoribonuclease Rv2179c-like domain-containing protein n=1 Tax=Oculimacula yallundae TaxID=86028 RepID=A0ABR4BXP4_9HELO